MYINYLFIKGLYPPLAMGGLWRRWYLLLYSGIRHYPPEAFGGANFNYKKSLGNIRCSTTKRIDTVVICGGLRKRIYELEKKTNFS